MFSAHTTPEKHITGHFFLKGLGHAILGNFV